MKANAEKGTDAEVTDAIASARDVKSFMVVRWVVKTICWMSFLKLQVYCCELRYISSMFHFLNSLLEDELLCSRNTNEHAVAQFRVYGNRLLCSLQHNIPVDTRT